MLDGWIIDWSTTLVLAAIVLLEGVRRVPAGAYILRRSPGSGWAVAEGPTERRRWRLASWGAPAAMHIVVAPGTPERTATREGTEDLIRRLRWRLTALRLLGGAVLLGVVLGVPAITARFGARGLLTTLGGVFGLSIVTAVVSGMAVRHMLGEPLRRTVGTVRGILSPFVAPRAAEIVLERALGDASPLVAARALVAPPRFAEWIRPRAYDLVVANGRRHGPGDSGESPGAELERALSRGECEAIIETPPAGRVEAEPYCPRCGDLYRDEMTACPGCEGVALRRG